MEDRASLAHELSAERKLPTVAHKHVLNLSLLLEALAVFQRVGLGAFAHTLFRPDVKIGGKAAKGENPKNESTGLNGAQRRRSDIGRA